MESNLRWYALQVQSRLAAVASAVLRAKKYEEYLPVYRSRRRWSDRVKIIDLPLFPGYLFCRFDPADRMVPVLTTPGVIGTVGAGKTPIPIDDSEIEALKTVLLSGLPAEPCPFLDVGSRIYMERGPLAGVEGIVSNSDKIKRLVVSISLLQRSVAVEIDRDWVRPVTAVMCPHHHPLLELPSPRAF